MQGERFTEAENLMEQKASYFLLKLCYCAYTLGHSSVVWSWYFLVTSCSLKVTAESNLVPQAGASGWIAIRNLIPEISRCRETLWIYHYRSVWTHTALRYQVQSGRAKAEDACPTEFLFASLWHYKHKIDRTGLRKSYSKGLDSASGPSRLHILLQQMDRGRAGKTSLSKGQEMEAMEAALQQEVWRRTRKFTSLEKTLESSGSVVTSRFSDSGVVVDASCKCILMVKEDFTKLNQGHFYSGARACIECYDYQYFRDRRFEPRFLQFCGTSNDKWAY